MQQFIKISLLMLCVVFGQASFFAATLTTAETPAIQKNVEKTGSEKNFAILKKKLQSAKTYLWGGDTKPEETGKISTPAVMGFLCGIASFLVAEIVFVVLLALLAIILSGVSINMIRTSAGKLKGRFFAIVGLILGIIAALLSFIYLTSL